MHYRFHAASDPTVRFCSDWVARRIPGAERGWDKCAAMVVFTNREVRGMVIYHDYNPEAGTICLSAAADGPWLNRDILTAMHDYVFEDADCQLAVLQVSEHNDRMNRIAKAVGYEPHRIPRLRGRDEAEIIWTLTDDHWRNSRFRRA